MDVDPSFLPSSGPKFVTLGHALFFVVGDARHIAVMRVHEQGQDRTGAATYFLHTTYAYRPGRKMMSRHDEAFYNKRKKKKEVRF